MADSVTTPPEPEEVPIKAFERRLADFVTPKQRALDRTVAVFLLVFLIAFLYQLVEILHRHTEWAYYQTPPGVGDVLSALLYGLMAIASALGLNVSRFVKGFKGD